MSGFFLAPLLLTLGCRETTDIEVSWPTDGCTSDHAPERDYTKVATEKHTLIAEDGVALAAKVMRPKTDGCWPAVVYVPPGFEAGLKEADEEATEVIAAAGVVVALYDPRGRGDSEGDEDYGGPLQQDDLAGIASWLAGREDVDPTRVLIRSRSFGVVHAAGALERYPEVAVFGLFDIEGPGLLPEDLDYASEFARDSLHDVSEGDEWWEERSPAQHIEAFPGAYRRIQALTDHQLGAYLGAARVMLEVASRESPEPVDMNGLTPEDSQLYESTDEAIWPYDMVSELALEGRVKHDDDRALDLLLDMF